MKFIGCSGRYYLLGREVRSAIKAGMGRLCIFREVLVVWGRVGLGWLRVRSIMKWSEKGGPIVSLVMILLVLGEIMRSSILPWTWVGEVMCCIRLKEVSRLLRDWVEGGLGKLKSPNIMVLGDIVCRKRWNSSRNGSMEGEGGR